MSNATSDVSGAALPLSNGTPDLSHATPDVSGVTLDLSGIVLEEAGATPESSNERVAPSECFPRGPFLDSVFKEHPGCKTTLGDAGIYPQALSGVKGGKHIVSFCEQP